MENQEQELIDNSTVDVKGQTIIFPAEWCFKFDDGEPQVFAAANEKIDGQEPAIKLVLSNTEEAKVTFTQDGKTFTIFCRTLTELGQELINKNNPIEDDRS
jgi:hypothetical protein